MAAQQRGANVSAGQTDKGKLIFRLLVLAVVVGLAISWSAIHKAPRTLPGAALGWATLFYVERAAALLAALGVALLVGWRALHGEFPMKFGQIEYEKRAAEAASDAAALLDERLRDVEELLGVRPASDIVGEETE